MPLIFTVGKSVQIILFFAFLIKNLNLGIAFLPIFYYNVFKNQSTEGFYMKEKVIFISVLVLLLIVLCIPIPKGMI